MGEKAGAAGGSSLTSPSSVGSCLEEEEGTGTGRDGGSDGRENEETEELRCRLLLELCSGSGSCRRLWPGAGDDSRDAGGDGGSSAGSGALTRPRIYEERVNGRYGRDGGGRRT